MSPVERYPTPQSSPKLQNTNRSRSNSKSKEVIQTSTTPTGPIAPGSSKSKQLLGDEEKQEDSGDEDQSNSEEEPITEEQKKATALERYKAEHEKKVTKKEG